jgi:hypothetical protein
VASLALTVRSSITPPIPLSVGGGSTSPSALARVVLGLLRPEAVLEAPYVDPVILAPYGRPPDWRIGASLGALAVLTVAGLAIYGAVCLVRS